MVTILNENPTETAVNAARNLLRQSGIFELRRNLTDGFSKLAHVLTETDFRSVPVLYTTLRKMGNTHLESLNEIADNFLLDQAQCA